VPARQAHTSLLKIGSKAIESRGGIIIKDGAYREKDREMVGILDQ
jgi:hypothetical protein